MLIRKRKNLHIAGKIASKKTTEAHYILGQRMKISILFLAVVLIFSGCARRPDAIRIKVHANKQFVVKGDTLTARQLRDFMREQYKRYGVLPVVLMTDTNLLHRDVRVAVDIATLCGYWQYSVASDIFTNAIPYPFLSTGMDEWEWLNIIDFEHGTIPTDAGISITLTNHAILVDDTQLTTEQAEDALSRLLGTARTNVLIRCDAYSDHDNLMALLNSCNSNKLHTVIFSM